MRVDLPARILFLIFVIPLNPILIFYNLAYPPNPSWFVLDLLTRSVLVYSYKTHRSFSFSFLVFFFSLFWNKTSLLYNTELGLYFLSYIWSID